MANPLLQKARQRKMIYFGAIVVLFTLSLIHREFILKPLSYALRLRESTRGEVELTSSAVRLMLTGSRGIAVTMLWYNAIDKQKRNEWNEFELLAKSITKLQPYFITPWLFQSWNIAFNISVECDRPRDKYYYISRGIELLHEGERRNRGSGESGATWDPRKDYPGNPDLRYYIGFMYQLKIGNSDERLTMRSLLELSCIDPLERNPDRFLTTNERGQKTVRLKEFARFTQKYPRLVRRLRDELGFADPMQVVEFLKDHQNIPNRFKPIEKSVMSSTNIKQSELKDQNEQFPLLPPHAEDWPDPNAYDLTNESINVFLVCRTWYDYSVKPMPPPNPAPTDRDPDYDKSRYRQPKQMMQILFRHYPARAQFFIAETLAAEGWFDSDGWNVQDWFDPLADKQDSEFFDDEGKFVIGKEPKYHSGAAWQKTYRAYEKFGSENGLYLEPAARAELERLATKIRKELNLSPEHSEVGLPDDWRIGERGKSRDAHVRLYYNQSYRKVSNFDSFLNQSDGERDPLTVRMRKTLFQAENWKKKSPRSEEMLALYDEAWRLHVQTCFKHPNFAQVEGMQQDMYDIYLRFLRDEQEVHRKVFMQSALGSAQQTPVAPPNWLDGIVRGCVVPLVAAEQSQLANIVPIPQRRGPLDAIRYYDGPSAKELREWLFAWTQGASAAMQPTVPATLSCPDQHYYLLTRATYSDEPPPPQWRPFITDETRRLVDKRNAQPNR